MNGRCIGRNMGREGGAAHVSGAAGPLTSGAPPGSSFCFSSLSLIFPGHSSGVCFEASLGYQLLNISHHP